MTNFSAKDVTVTWLFPQLTTATAERDAKESFCLAPRHLPVDLENGNWRSKISSSPETRSVSYSDY